MLSFGGRVNQMKDLSVLLDLATARPAPVPFVRRTLGGNTASPFDVHGNFESVLEATPGFTSATPGLTTTTPGVPPVSAEITPATSFAPTPRPPPLVTERTLPPGTGSGEDRDYHAALAKS